MSTCPPSVVNFSLKCQLLENVNSNIFVGIELFGDINLPSNYGFDVIAPKVVQIKFDPFCTMKPFSKKMFGKIFVCVFIFAKAYSPIQACTQKLLSVFLFLRLWNLSARVLTVCQKMNLMKSF
jgi:hypothetical protein